MGAALVGAVIDAWSHIDGEPYKLLVKMAHSVPDRMREQPVSQLGRDTMARALGYATLTDAARQAVKRALAKLVRLGVIVVTRMNAPGRRRHYLLKLWPAKAEQEPAEQPEQQVSDVDGTGVTDRPQQGSPSDPCPTGHTYIPRSGEDLQEEVPPAHMRMCAAHRFDFIAGGSDMATSGQQQLPLTPAPNLRPMPLPAQVAAEQEARQQHAELIRDGFVGYAAAQGLIVPHRRRAWYAEQIESALQDGFPELIVKKALVAMLDDRVLDRPHLLESYVMRAQGGPERGRGRGRRQLVEHNGLMVSQEHLEHLAMIERMRRLDEAEAAGAAGPQLAVGW